jgi:hypothetical protein
MDRRDLVSGGLVAGAVAIMSAAGDAEAARQTSAQDTSRNAMETNRAVNEVRMLLERHYDAPWVPIGQIRAQQGSWLRTTQKFPDFMEVGLGVWQALYDWHVRYQQPINMSRGADGRYLMSFMFTTLVLRPDVDVNYVGPAYDNDRRPGQ